MYLLPRTFLVFKELFVGVSVSFSILAIHGMPVEHTVGSRAVGRRDENQLCPIDTSKRNGMSRATVGQEVSHLEGVRPIPSNKIAHLPGPNTQEFLQTMPRNF